MKNVVKAFLFVGMISGTVMASESQDNTNVLFDNYIQSSSALKGAHWDYLGCAASKASCAQKAAARGYTESILAGITCTPRSTDRSCFAR